jgi:hypothetical protein
MSGMRPTRALAAPLSFPGFREEIGEAIWLYLYLLVSANYRGVVLRHLSRLGNDLAVPAGKVEAWLSRLQGTRLIDIESAAPFLAIKLRSWSSDEGHRSEQPAEKPKQSIDSPLGVPVGSNAAAAAASSNRENGGPGEGEGLLRDVLSILGETDEAEFREILKQHPAERVRQALARVQATPASQIRKSKAALFRYLLAKLA